MPRDNQAWIELGLTASDAERLRAALDALPKSWSAQAQWREASQRLLHPAIPFAAHQQVFAEIYRQWDSAHGPPPIWIPTDQDVRSANVTRLAERVGAADYPALHAWAAANRGAFWQTVIEQLGIAFDQPYRQVLDETSGAEHARWLVDGRWNITNSCFQADADQAALIFQAEGGPLTSLTYGALKKRVDQAAHAVRRMGLEPGDAVGVMMPLTPQSVALFLGLIRAGCWPVAVAESFSSKEIESRLGIVGAKAIFLQDYLVRDGKRLESFEKCRQLPSHLRRVVAPCAAKVDVELDDHSIAWDDLLGDAPGEPFQPLLGSADDVTTILFSSGTTAAPKAIPWTQATPLKCAADAWLHHNVSPRSVLCWPTSLGWMMGPWLIYASLINRATMALYDGSPKSRDFGKFVERAGVTMLGVVPSLVRAWRSGGALDACDWSRIELLSSTGECSNADDMWWLTARAGYRPVIEYCGGTEVGGGYITSTVVRPCAPATFTTAALGLDFVILDEDGREADMGEVYLTPPSIGFSQRLTNADHHEVYYADVPPGPHGEQLRRHGDALERIPGGYYRVGGRTDDTMNLGGIKVSSAELERCLNQMPGIQETAAVAVAGEEGGPSALVVFVVASSEADARDQYDLRTRMQRRLSEEVNPLFRIHRVEVIEAMPRTPSNKIMRRLLRQRLQSSSM